jgi:hypothetical protein
VFPRKRLIAFARTGVVRIGYAVEPPFALVGASRAG